MKGQKKDKPVTPRKKGTSARRLFDTDYSMLAPRFKLMDGVGELSDVVDSMLSGKAEEEEDEEYTLTAVDLLLPCEEEAQKLMKNE